MYACMYNMYVCIMCARMYCVHVYNVYLCVYLNIKQIEAINQEVREENKD